jgi:hypothetical protein
MDDIVNLTSEAKKTRIAVLQDLLQSEGWAIIQQEINADIAITEAKLFGEAPLAPGETVEGLRRERIDRLELRDLPQNLVEEYSEEEPDAPDLDVYE